MTKYFCDSCKQEITGEPLVLTVESLHHRAVHRNALTLCGDCEREIHFAIHNTITNHLNNGETVAKTPPDGLPPFWNER